MFSHYNLTPDGNQVFLINNSMKMKEIIVETNDLNELHRIAMNDPFGAAGSELDKRFNPEAGNYAEDERQKYPKVDFTPVVKKDADNPARKKMTTIPKKDEPQSPGYRGREKAKERAGMQHREYQKANTAYRQPLLNP